MFLTNKGQYHQLRFELEFRNKGKAPGGFLHLTVSAAGVTKPCPASVLCYTLHKHKLGRLWQGSQGTLSQIGALAILSIISFMACGQSMPVLGEESGQVRPVMFVVTGPVALRYWKAGSPALFQASFSWTCSSQHPNWWHAFINCPLLQCYSITVLNIGSKELMCFDAMSTALAVAEFGASFLPPWIQSFKRYS